MSVDRWDIIGAVGVLLIGAGVWRLATWPWAVIWLGVVLGALYIVRELRMRGA